MRTGRLEHISPVLQELHLLPVRRRVVFKLATLMFQVATWLRTVVSLRLMQVSAQGQSPSPLV